MTNESQFRESLIQSAHDAQFLCKHLNEAHSLVVTDKRYNILNSVAHYKLLELLKQSAEIRDTLANIAGITLK